MYQLFTERKLSLKNRSLCDRKHQKATNTRIIEKGNQKTSKKRKAKRDRKLEDTKIRLNKQSGLLPYMERGHERSNRHKTLKFCLGNNQSMEFKEK